MDFKETECEAVVIIKSKEYSPSWEPISRLSGSKFPFMEPVVSLSFSREPSCRKPDESNPHTED